MKPSGPAKPGVVQSVDRALALLEALAETRGGMRLSDLARGVGLPASTTHRLLTTLQGRGFAQNETQSGKWLIGQRAFSVGEKFPHHENLVAPARAVLRQLRDMTRETANLGLIESEATVTIAQAESREIMRAIAPPGGRVPILNSGMGKAIAATWPDDAIRMLVQRKGLPPLTSNSLKSESEVIAEISRIREQGYAVDNEEYVVGMRCVAAVVWSANSEPVAAISVSGLAARVPISQIGRFAEQVVGMAEKLTDIIGGTPLAQGKTLSGPFSGRQP